MSDLLPPSASDQERAISLSIARAADGSQADLRSLWDPWSAPADLLPWLAWSFSVDDWDSEWTDSQKRSAIDRSIDVHRYKGTIGAVREALEALGIEIHLVEWFNQAPQGDPYTFDILLDAQLVPIDERTISAIVPLINATKNLRSHLGSITPGATTKPVVRIGAACVVGHDTTINLQYSRDGFDLLYAIVQTGDQNPESVMDDMHTFVHQKLPVLA